MKRRPPRPTLFPYPTLFRSLVRGERAGEVAGRTERGHQFDGVLHGQLGARADGVVRRVGGVPEQDDAAGGPARSEEHTSELQSRQYLVCRLLLEKKKHTSIRPSVALQTLDGRSHHLLARWPHLCIFFNLFFRHPIIFPLLPSMCTLLTHSVCRLI